MRSERILNYRKCLQRWQQKALEGADTYSIIMTSTQTLSMFTGTFFAESIIDFDRRLEYTVSTGRNTRKIEIMNELRTSYLGMFFLKISPHLRLSEPIEELKLTLRAFMWAND
jgi:hypothetical protein